jgi:SAM-dependent methyltransferase
MWILGGLIGKDRLRRLARRMPSAPPHVNSGIVSGVGLPAVEPLLSLPRETWRALGRRLLAIGLDNAAVKPFWEKPGRGHPLRSPMVKWHLRRIHEPSAYAMRMLMFWDAVTPDEARAAFGEDLPLEPMLEVGFLRRTEEERVVSPFAMQLADQGRLYVFCDDPEPGGDAVMAPSLASLALASFARPRVRAVRALDLGCGPGTVALTMASMCDRVVATDIAQRAIALAKVNAWVNGIDNVEFRTGDLFEPVGDESFDVVASQPPFIPRPPEVPESVFLFGGDRGDELPLRVLREVPRHLTPGGLAALLVGWPVAEGDAPLGQRLREALGTSRDLSLLVLQTAGGEETIINPCIAYARIRNGSDDAGYERDVMRFREHFERRKIRSLRDTYTFVRRGTGHDVGWTSVVQMQELGRTPAARGSIDLLLGAGDRAFRASDRKDSPDRGMVSIDLSATIPIQSALSMAQYLATTGHPDEAMQLYHDVLQRYPTWRAALLGAARLEIASGNVDGWPSRLTAVAELADREARRLVGDIHWKRQEVEIALGCYAIEPRPPVTSQSSFTPCPFENKVEVPRCRTQARSFLVWVTGASFEGSVVAGGLRLDQPRLWDLAVNCFGPSGQRIDERAEYVIEGGLSKLSAVKATIAAHPEILRGYHAVLLLDDDIEIAHEDVDRFFWLMSRYQLDLAHPSLSQASTGPCPPMFHQRESVVRFTNTVDVRAPAFSRAGLATCIDSFDQSISGEGLGSVWSHLLEHRRNAIGVVDGVTVGHLRPIDVFDGSFYRHLNALGIDPTQEMHELHREYGCWFLYPRTIGDVDSTGRERHYGE